MRFLPLIWSGLWRKPARTIFTLLSIMIVFLLFGVMIGLNAGFAKIIAEARLDRIEVNARFGGQMPLSHTEQIARLDGVRTVASGAVLGGHYQDRTNGLGVIMTDERLLAIWPELPLPPEDFAAMQRLRTGAVVSRAMAERFKWKVGDRIPIQSPTNARSDGSTIWPFDIVAITPDFPGLQNGYIAGNYDYFDEGRVKDKGTVTFIQIIVENPERADEIARAIDALFANSVRPTRSASQKARMESGLRGLVDINFLSNAVVGAALLMLLVLTGNVTAQSVRERIPEFAVLKTIGYSDSRVLALVLAEAVFPCVAGALLGLGLAYAASPYAHYVLPPGLNAPLPEIGAVTIYGVLTAVLLALASGLPAAVRMKRLSIADALAGR
jgi:putative ABC transport system permease protein